MRAAARAWGVLSVAAGLLAGCALEDPVTGRACLDDRDCAGGKRVHYCVNDAPEGVPRVCVPGDRPLPLPENRAPLIGTNVVVVRGGEVVRGTLNVADPDGDPLTFSLQGAPEGLGGLMVLNTNQYEYTSDAVVNGVIRDPFRIVVEDGHHRVEFKLLMIVVGTTDDGTFSTWLGLVDGDWNNGPNWDPADRVPDETIDVLLTEGEHPLSGNAIGTVGRLFSTPEVTPSLQSLRVHGDAAFASGRINADVVFVEQGPTAAVGGLFRTLDVRRDIEVVSPVNVSVGLTHDRGQLRVVQGSTLEVDGDLLQLDTAGDVMFVPDEDGTESLYAPPTLVVKGRAVLARSIEGASGRVLIRGGLEAHRLQPPTGVEVCFVPQEGETEVDVPRDGAFLRRTVIEEGAQVRFLGDSDVIGDMELHGGVGVVAGGTVRVFGTLFIQGSVLALAEPNGQVVANACAVSPFTEVPAYIHCMGGGGLDAGVRPDAHEGIDAGRPDAAVDGPDGGGLDASVDAGGAPDVDPLGTDAGLDAGSADVVMVDPDAGIDAGMTDVDPGLPDGGGPDGGGPDGGGPDAVCDQLGPSPFLRNSIATGWGTGTVSGSLALDPGWAVVPGSYPLFGDGGGEVTFTGAEDFDIERVEAAGSAYAVVDVFGPDGPAEPHCVWVFRSLQLTYTTSGDSMATSFQSNDAWNEVGSPGSGDDAVMSHDLGLGIFDAVNHLWIEPQATLSGSFAQSIGVFGSIFSTNPVSADVRLEREEAVAAGSFERVSAEKTLTLVANISGDGLDIDPDLFGNGAIDIGHHRLTIGDDFNLTGDVPNVLNLTIAENGLLDIEGDFMVGEVSSTDMSGTIIAGGFLSGTFAPHFPNIIHRGDVDVQTDKVVTIDQVGTFTALGPSEVQFESPCNGIDGIFATAVDTEPGANVTFETVTLEPGFVDLTNNRLCFTVSCTDNTGDGNDDCADLCQ